ncbi:hypothetical protein RHM62_10525 [Actimicrobium sp. CCC2.4]|uniref:hypothetical protein n=1 Tax=Actimicrobium sp. CCC2.4 TaxID=3048606 RepID=UPI002AC8DCBD|nr:hypothetical protein [Actimicrobium sp. CCC2.4]WPX30709.1 hypothetical protein RHM62_10525 [Actimicrobium sp. CCC2.4]
MSPLTLHCGKQFSNAIPTFDARRVTAFCFVVPCRNNQQVTFRYKPFIALSFDKFPCFDGRSMRMVMTFPFKKFIHAIAIT